MSANISSEETSPRHTGPAIAGTPPEPITATDPHFDMYDDPAAESSGDGQILQSALRELRAEVWPVFTSADREALRQQRYHRTLARMALSFGTLAVVAAILQLAVGGETIPITKFTAAFEVVSIFLCATSVVFGITTARQHRWLTCRHVAERCRSLKFHSLCWAELWTNKLDAWRNKLGGRLEMIVADKSPQALHEWLEYEPLVARLSLPNPGELTCDLQPLKDYYRHKRLKVQIRYFSVRSSELRTRIRALYRLPVLCFFGSVVLAMAHFAADLGHASSLHAFAHWCIVGAAALPVVGAGIRSWLLAFEFSRSSSLFGAKARTLREFDKKLESAVGPGVLLVIWECETFLEEEHRDWLRLVHEAEWFG